MKLKVKDWEESLLVMSTSKENKQSGEVTIPENVKITKEGNVIIVEGKNGKIKKDFTKIPIKLVFEENKIMIHPPGQRRKDLALINTIKSILSSMIKGVETGFTYKLKIIFSHFPISVKVKDKKVIVENYFGERSSRISKIVGDTKVEISGEDVIVKGPSLEDVSQTATNIESSTKIKNKDQRVFLDGVYVYAKQDGL
jgi:large subunit ribosomal protein L6